MTRAAIVHDNGKTAMQVFAETYVENGSNATRAAITAGYSPATATAKGSALLNNPKVQAAVRQAQMKYLGGELSNLALSVLKSIMIDETAPASARVESAKTVLDRAGISKAAVVVDTGKQINEMTETELLTIIGNYQNKIKDLDAIEHDSSSDAMALDNMK